MPTLLQIAQDMEALDALLDELGGDITDEQVASYIDQLLDEQGEAFDLKVDGYCALIRDRLAVAEAQRHEAEHLLGRAKTQERQAQSLKSRLLIIMQSRGIKKAGRVYTASVANNGGKLPINGLDQIDPAQLPESMQRVTVAADTEAIRQALEDGQELPGLQLGERGQHLRVR